MTTLDSATEKPCAKRRGPEPGLAKPFIGQVVTVIAGPTTGQVGRITDLKVRIRQGVVRTSGEYRVEFSAPLHLPRVGFLTAVWRKAAEIEPLARGKSAPSKSEPAVSGVQGADQ
jgi:hypothetical protein